VRPSAASSDSAALPARIRAQAASRWYRSGARAGKLAVQEWIKGKVPARFHKIGDEIAKFGTIGLINIGVNSAVVNLPVKYAARRKRPDRSAAGVPAERWVDMPTSTSFPSGHSASAFAFATAVGGTLPALGFPLRGLAAIVAYSRVHTGVHYPGDVIAGSLIGAWIGKATAVIARRVRRRAHR